MRIRPIKKAINTVAKGAAEVLDHETNITYDFETWSVAEVLPHHDFIRTGRSLFRMPEIIVLSSYNVMPKHNIKVSKQNVAKRDNYECAYCLTKLKPSQVSIDHVIPKSKKGGNGWDNVVCACLRCNGKKGNKTPGEAGLKLHKNPRKPMWWELTGRDDWLESWKQFFPK